ncbi:MAG: hypothetical protein MJY45_05795 [Bacteroidales bacterium]|nr:hypothetical protein [Bacteroidales bacterium]
MPPLRPGSPLTLPNNGGTGRSDKERLPERKRGENRRRDGRFAPATD